MRLVKMTINERNVSFLLKTHFLALINCTDDDVILCTTSIIHHRDSPHPVYFFGNFFFRAQLLNCVHIECCTVT